MYKLKDIKRIHLEITQRCQAACSMCDRNISGGEVNPHLDLSELSLEDIKKIMSPDFISQLVSIQLCGNYGDPIIAEDTLEILEYLRIHNSNMWISMNTNAGARDSEWWTKLAKIINKKGNVIFSVDGLEDTNHLYRQNVQWRIVERSMHSFIAAGGRARWDFLVFDFNQHQVEEARELSIKWGFERFIVKKSSRFITGNSIPKEVHQAINRKGEKTIEIKKPTEELQNSVLKKQDAIIEKYNSMDEYYDVAPISCRVKDEGSMYISAEGIVMPCCWTAGRMYKWWHQDPKVEQVWEFIDNAGGKDALNAKIVGLENVFTTGIFEAIEASWNKPSCNEGKLKVCAMKCTKEFDVVGSQYD
jgi:MoaA/NifB/PqqE/SkfB family radical SAM enzyme